MPPSYGNRLTTTGLLSPQPLEGRSKKMVMEIKLGDVVRLRKKHPCGNDEWEVVRVGADIGIRCLKCQRYVMLERPIFERRVKAFVPRRQK